MNKEYIRNSVVVTVRCSDDTIKQLNYLTDHLKVNRNKLINELINKAYISAQVDNGIDNVVYQMKRAILSIDDLTRQIDKEFKERKNRDEQK